MDVINVNNRQVIKCIHCNGTGICAHSDHLFVEHTEGEKTFPGWVLYCTKCGHGNWYSRAYKGRGLFSGWFSKAPPYRDMKPPVCAVCGGTGHIIVG